MSAMFFIVQIPLWTIVTLLSPFAHPVIFDVQIPLWTIVNKSSADQTQKGNLVQIPLWTIVTMQLVPLHNKTPFRFLYGRL